MQYYKKPLPGDDFPEDALRSMAWAAAKHSLELDRELRNEVTELRATVAGLQSRLKQQDKQQQDLRATVARLERQRETDAKQLQAFAGLQASVAAMGAQLKALLPQDSVQQG
jgi:septal ring factor EnvC (AmiA/AmiB activator)